MDLKLSNEQVKPKRKRKTKKNTAKPNTHSETQNKKTQDITNVRLTSKTKCAHTHICIYIYISSK